MQLKKEICAICGCMLHRSGKYATDDIEGRSHASEHHFIAERFFGRSKNRKSGKRKAIFTSDPWKTDGKKTTLCYDCHEELLHNPIFLPDDVAKLAVLVKRNKLNEKLKANSRIKLRGRIVLLHKIIETGIKILLENEKEKKG